MRICITTDDDGDASVHFETPDGIAITLPLEHSDVDSHFEAPALVGITVDTSPEARR
ncbi:hypothetical protein [Embleya sp. NPDC001921]